MTTLRTFSNNMRKNLMHAVTACGLCAVMLCPALLSGYSVSSRSHAAMQQVNIDTDISAQKSSIVAVSKSAAFPGAQLKTVENKGRLSFTENSIFKKHCHHELKTFKAVGKDAIALFKKSNPQVASKTDKLSRKRSGKNQRKNRRK